MCIMIGVNKGEEYILKGKVNEIILFILIVTDAEFNKG